MSGPAAPSPEPSLFPLVVFVSRSISPPPFLLSPLSFRFVAFVFPSASLRRAGLLPTGRGAIFYETTSRYLETCAAERTQSGRERALRGETKRGESKGSREESGERRKGETRRAKGGKGKAEDVDVRERESGWVRKKGKVAQEVMQEAMREQCVCANVRWKAPENPPDQHKKKGGEEKRSARTFNRLLLLLR